MLKRILSVLVVSCFIAPMANAFDYAQCEKRAQPLGFDEVAKCKHSQMLIEQKKLQELYSVISNSKDLNVLNQTDYKKMYDGWLLYRDSYCTVYAKVATDYTEKYNKEHCLHEHTKNARLYMQALIDYHFSDLD